MFHRNEEGFSLFGGDHNTNSDESIDRWVLGRRYDEEDLDGWTRHYRSVPWFTYRQGFRSMDPYPYTDDAGWGCMLRSAQMMMAQGLLRHKLGRDWRAPRDLDDLRKCKPFCNLLLWFADAPGPRCVFSIHNMVQVGMNYDKLPGEWYGPSTVAYVLRDLARVHHQYLGGGVRVMVTQAEVIYIDEVHRLCTPSSITSSASPPPATSTSSNKSTATTSSTTTTSSSPPSSSSSLAAPFSSSQPPIRRPNSTSSRPSGSSTPCNSDTSPIPNVGRGKNSNSSTSSSNKQQQQDPLLSNNNEKEEGKEEKEREAEDGGGVLVEEEEENRIGGVALVVADEEGEENGRGVSANNEEEGIGGKGRNDVSKVEEGEGGEGGEKLLMSTSSTSGWENVLAASSTLSDDLSTSPALLSTSSFSAFFDPLLNRPPHVVEEDEERRRQYERKQGEVGSSSYLPTQPWKPGEGVIIIIPLRLGLATLNADYIPGILGALQIPQTLGFIGGKPNHAIYFVGSHGTELMGLDPHTVQTAPQVQDTHVAVRDDAFPPAADKEGSSTRSTTTSSGSGNTSYIPPEDYVRSTQCRSPQCMQAKDLDPSLALGFYVRHEVDFEDLCRRVRLLKKELASRGLPTPLSIEESPPQYEGAVGVTAMMKSMMDEDMSEEGSLVGGRSGGREEEGDDEGSDVEDEYVIVTAGS